MINPYSINVLFYVTHRLTPAVLAVFTLSVVGDFTSPAAATDTDRPNVVLIISDDQGWSDYGFMGHEQVETPHLDELARRSAVFKRGYVPTALCRPSLATLLTGHYASTTHVTGNDPSPKYAAKGSALYRRRRAELIAKTDPFDLLPRALQRRGYLSHQSGKLWEGSYQRCGFTHGMTRGFPGQGGRHGDDGLTIGRKGLEPIFRFLDIAEREQKPFFLWYAPFLPHTPHTPPQRLVDKYAAKVDSPSIARYYAMCEWFDETCGELIGELDRREMTENTLIVYVCDNGWIQNAESNGFASRSKQSANEGGVRTPILYAWPGKILPQTRTELASSLDIYPTILTAAGGRPPDNLPGLNLIPALASRDPIERDHLFGEGFAHDIADLNDPSRSLLYQWVIRDRYKLLLRRDGETNRYASRHRTTEPPVQLYDLAMDPAEETNLASEKPGLVRDLTSLIDSWQPLEHPSVAASASPRPPDIVVYLADDLSAADLPLYGGKNIETPAIDQLAADGMTFDRAFVASPCCAASRAALLTGLMPARNGAEENHSYPHEDVARLPAVLGAMGYQTAAFGKVAHSRSAPSYQFEVHDPGQDIPELRRRVKEFLRSRSDPRPLALFVGVSNPHVPWPEETTIDPDSLDMPPQLLDTPRTRVQRSRYLQEVKDLDTYLAELRELTERHLSEDCLFVFSSDHGAQFPFGKWTLYDEGVRVPLIVARKRTIVAGSRTDAMVSWVDLLPTLIDIGGGEVPPDLDGRSFASVLHGKYDSHRDRIHTTHSGDRLMNVYLSRSVRTHRHKLIWNVHPEFAFTTHIDLLLRQTSGDYFKEWITAATTDPRAADLLARFHGRPEYELYDLTNDPNELNNLAGDSNHATVQRMLTAELKAWIENQGDSLTVFRKPLMLDAPETWKSRSTNGK